MKPFRDILLIADPERAESPAYRRARGLAQSSGARLHVELFEYRSSIDAAWALDPALGDRARRELIELRRRWLDARERELATAGLQVRTSLTWGGPVHEHIIARLLRRPPDLVVKDVGLVAPLRERLLVTPLDWQLLRLCPMPLLLVNAGARDLPRRVFAAVDPMAPGDGGLAERVLVTGEMLARACGAGLHAAHAFEGLPALAPRPESHEALRAAHRERFEAAAERHGIAPAQRHFLEGSPEALLSQLAIDPEGDVLALATVTRAGRERVVLGSTIERLMEAVGCDVLAVKPEGFEADLQRKFPGVTATARPQLRAVK